MQWQLEELGELTAQIYFLYSEWAKKQGINFNVLAVFYTINKYGQCTQKQVCTEWVVPKQTMSAVCKQLEQEGGIVLAPSEGDKREKTLSFTEQGRARALPVLAQMRHLEETVLAEFGERNMQEMLVQMRRFTELFVRITA